MVTGMPPFYSPDELKLKELIRSGNYSDVSIEFNDKAPKDLQDLLQNIFHVNPDKRVDADDMVADAWVNSAHQVFRELSRSVVN